MRKFVIPLALAASIFLTATVDTAQAESTPNIVFVSLSSFKEMFGVKNISIGIGADYEEVDTLHFNCCGCNVAFTECLDTQNKRAHVGVFIEGDYPASVSDALNVFLEYYCQNSEYFKRHNMLVCENGVCTIDRFNKCASINLEIDTDTLNEDLTEVSYYLAKE